MDKGAKIYVAGHRGLVGSAILRDLQAKGYANFVLRSHAELELENQAAVRAFFEAERPEYVFLAAAKVGGIYANSTYPADFIYNNLLIEVNVIHAAHLCDVKKLLFLGSSCIYPKFAPQPMREEYLLSGELEPTTSPTRWPRSPASSSARAYRRQYGPKLHRGDADESLWSQRQLRSDEQPRSPGPHPPFPRGEAEDAIPRPACGGEGRVRGLAVSTPPTLPSHPTVPGSWPGAPVLPGGSSSPATIAVPPASS